MWKILSTNLLTYNWYSSSQLFNKILSVPKKFDYKIVQKSFDWERPWDITTRWTRIYEDNMTWDGYIPNLPSSYWNNWILAWTSEPIIDTATWWMEIRVAYTYQSWPTEFTLATLDSTQKTTVLNVYNNSVIPAMNELWYNQYAYQPNTTYWFNALLQWDNWKWYWMVAASTDWSTYDYVPFELESNFSFNEIWTPDTAPTGSDPNYYNINFVFWDDGPKDWAISKLVNWVTTVNELWEYIAWLLWY